LVIAQQYVIIKTVIPLLKKLAQRNQIELSVSPFFHPILPLLIDRDAAKEALSGSPMPEHNFNGIDEARWQLTEARKYFKKVFGSEPNGIWPSEGSLSEAALKEIDAAGFKWAATDQGILSHSLMKTGRPIDWPLASWELYSPWKLKGLSTALFFRDLSFSNDISFKYSSWKGSVAAKELIRHLESIYDQIPEDQKEPAIVSIIMDGENAWEFYEKNAIDFFRSLYRALTKHPKIETTTYSDYLEQYPAKNITERLWSGSWIYSNFGTWIGCREKNKAWDLLTNTKNLVFSKKGKVSADKYEQALWELRVAEGSDWFWWLGYDHNSEYDREFEESFRGHLVNAYKLLGETAPEEYHHYINDYQAYPFHTYAQNAVTMG
jgi:alpha-amylase/alpha-mannosidase (GH57 family)